MSAFDESRMKIFVNFPSVEEELRLGIDSQVSQILLTEAKNGERESSDVIFDYLHHDEWEQRLKTLIGLSGGSLERLKRVFVAISDTDQWPNLREDAAARRIIANFLTAPDYFKEQVPEFIRRCFYLKDGWVQSLRDPHQVTALVINSSKSKYAVQCGFAQEKNIISIVEKVGLVWEKGPVEMVNAKEVDVAIPNTSNPQLLIMSSYNLTTSSSQSSRANEHTLMYEDILRHNRRKNEDVQFWNVIDGGGWLSRRSDLTKILKNANANFCNADIADGTFERALRTQNIT